MLASQGIAASAKSAKVHVGHPLPIPPLQQLWHLERGKGSLAGPRASKGAETALSNIPHSRCDLDA